MSFEITGKLIEKYDTQQIKDTFKKREFVLETTEDINGNIYSNFVKMQLIQMRCDLIDRFQEGDMIKVWFNIKGNKWERDDKVNYITNLDAWRIEPASEQQSSVPAYQASSTSNIPPSGNPSPTQGDDPQQVDDLPF